MKIFFFKKSAFQTVVIIWHHIKQDIQYTLWWCVAQPLGLLVRIYSTKDCLHLSTNLFITNKAAFQLQMCVFVDVLFWFFLNISAPPDCISSLLMCPRYSVVTILWGLFYFCVLQSILWNRAEWHCGNRVMNGGLSELMDLLNLLRALC